MKLINPTLITLNNTLHIKADNLEAVEVDSSLWDFLYHNPHTWNWNADLATINVDHLVDRIEVREKRIAGFSPTSAMTTKRAFLLPAKEDIEKELFEMENQLGITGNARFSNRNPIEKSYTIEEIEKAIDDLGFIYDNVKEAIINNLKK